MSQDILIRGGKISIIERSDGDVTSLPDDSPIEGATLITEDDWIALVDDAGSEEAVMETLGVTEDLRDEGEGRYEPTIAEEG